MVDRNGMAAVIAGLPDQLRQGGRLGAAAGDRLEMPSAIVFAGMGGSAIGGELLRGLIADACPVPVTRVRGFGIPTWAGPGTLVVCVSYSGSTAETLACARQAHWQGASLLTVAGGGELAEMAESWGAAQAVVPPGLQPRAALGYLFGAIAGAFSEAGLAPAGLAEQAALGAELADRDAARELGEQLSETVPLVYGAGPLAIVAYRWKTQLNENAKMHAFSHAFPEMGHNEIVGWQGADLAQFAAVILRDPTERAENTRMIEAARDLIAGDAAMTVEVEATGQSPAARAFSLVSQGDWVSYHAALARGVDPTPVERILALKERLEPLPE
ncbi:MAG: bifunctional phosphoglucose/phosphomannose isomerase [Gaiellales bacterium]